MHLTVNNMRLIGIKNNVKFNLNYREIKFKWLVNICSYIVYNILHYLIYFIYWEIFGHNFFLMCRYFHNDNKLRTCAAVSVCLWPPNSTVRLSPSRHFYTYIYVFIYTHKFIFICIYMYIFFYLSLVSFSRFDLWKSTCYWLYFCFVFFFINPLESFRLPLKYLFIYVNGYLFIYMYIGIIEGEVEYFILYSSSHRQFIRLNYLFIHFSMYFRNSNKFWFAHASFFLRGWK